MLVKQNGSVEKSTDPLLYLETYSYIGFER